ncbi:hypothetical protein [Flavobacterium sp.]|uniref:hypothetical protein n=1 Tax=Flavobacterium sp. TaxID=239 RepID=UPI003D6B187F
MNAEVTVQSTKKKRSVNETGHAKNIFNFQNLISFCQGYGSAYNPSKENLKIIALVNQHQRAFDRLHQAKADKTSFDLATNNRRIEFENLKPLSTRILSAFMVSGADKLIIDDLKVINRKIQGPIYKKTKDDAPDDEVRKYSTSQQSYSRFIDHFASLLEVLEQSQSYHPNENELKLAALQLVFETMKRTHNDLTDAYTQYSNALIRRNRELYDGTTGLVQTTKEVKLYAKSIFGANSPQYRQISKIVFKMFKEL